MAVQNLSIDHFIAVNLEEAEPIDEGEIDDRIGSIYGWGEIVRRFGNDPEALKKYVTLCLLDDEAEGDLYDFLLSETFLIFPNTAKEIIKILPKTRLVGFTELLKECSVDGNDIVSKYYRKMKKFYLTLLQ
jgi:hypothetical protein